jgi:predicted CoA-binding protein
VNVYRGEEEHAGIIAMHVAPLGAKVLWLQPPITSATARRITAERGLAFVEGVDIAEMTRNLGIRKSQKQTSIT